MRERTAGLGRWVRSVRPRKGTLRYDAVAGLPGAIGSVPDGMASSVLAGVNPIHGLYASFAGPIAGGLTSSTELMVVATTSAAALAAGSAIAGVDSSVRPEALFWLTIIAGAAMVAAGVLRLGRYTRFVSHSVMIGFLTGVAANIVFGQVPDLTGVDAEGSFALAKFIDVLTHPGEISVTSLLVGLAAIAILVVLARTPAASYSSVIALIVPTLVVMVTGADGVASVDDGGPIPSGLPLPHLPTLSLLSFDVVAGALAVAAIVLVQGAGVSESVPNPDGRVSNPNRDFVAQGVGNIASGFFKGQPVGGSVGQTALNVTAGARGRWASIFSGLWMLVILVAFSGAVGVVAMPTLAAVLIYAAVGSLRTGEVTTIWRTGTISQIAITATFVATLFLPIPIAVGVGVALSLLLQLNREALDLTVVELVVRPDGLFEEHPAPSVLPSNAVTLLDVYGSLYYAGARTLQARLPDPAGSTSPAVVLRLRHRTALGATFLVVLADYARRVAAVDGRLFLSGIDPVLLERMRRTGRVEIDGPVGVFEATEVVGESSMAAVHEAETWIVKHPSPPPS